MVMSGSLISLETVHIIIHWFILQIFLGDYCMQKHSAVSAEIMNKSFD